MGRGQELLDAARKGDERTVSKIIGLITKRSGPFTSLRRGAGVNVQDDNGYTPLHHACLNGHREIVHVLLSVDASPCVVDKKGATPLHLAAWKGDSNVVSMLLNHANPPVNIDQQTIDQETALIIAARFGFVDVVTLLIAKGADVTLRNHKEESALDLAAQYGKLEVVKLLINAQPNLIEPYTDGRGRCFSTTPLHRASMNGHKDVVAYLIDAGIDPNIRTDNGTALHEGVRYLSASVVRVLLSKGADLKALDRKGHSVHALLKTYSEEATRIVKRVIREYESKMKSGYESEEDLPQIPCHDYSPTGFVKTPVMKAPETQKNTNFNLSMSPSSSSLTKNHQSFVKKLASKCLGLKAKFNSAPNISNSSGIDSDACDKLHNLDQKSNSQNTLLIGNSKFFNKILSKKEKTGDIVCTDEFDTISLDRLGTLNRDSAVNRSNRSCPGFKTSLPNISENAEVSDSESVIITEIDCDIPKHDKSKEAINLSTKFSIFEPRQSTTRSISTSETVGDSADQVNECYEACNFSDCKEETTSENNNSIPKPLPRANVAIHSSKEGLIYENFTVVSKVVPPKPAVRNHIPKKILLDEVQRKALYENVTVLKEKVQAEDLHKVNYFSEINETTDNSKKTLTSRSSTTSSDSMEDESNLEDILLSEKSKSFKRGEKCTVYPSKSDISRTQSNASNVSEFTEASAIENVDCSEEIYTNMTGTLPHKTEMDPEKKKKILFRHKTFTNIEVDRNSINFNKTSHWHYEFMKETLAHYHIRGTGHCIYKAPTVQEFIYIFNREALYSDTPPFTKISNDKRDSYYETAICFCKPKVPKYHKSAEDLLGIPLDEKVDENAVTIDIDALRARNEIISTSFRCFCDSGACTLHAKKRESPNNLIVKFSAVKKSISTPDITLDSSLSVDKRSSLTRRPSEIHYASTSIEDIVLRNKAIEIEKPKSPVYTIMSQPSTISSSTGPYSIKDIADVISLDSHSESTEASPICALNSVHLSLRKSTSSEYSGRWTLASSNSNTTVQSDISFKTCQESPEEDSDDGTLHSDGELSDTDTVKSDVSTAKRPWVHSDSFNFGQNGPKLQNYAILEEDSNSSDDQDDIIKFESPSKVESGISVGGSDSSSSGCDGDSGIPGVDAVSLGVASLERDAGCGGVRSGSGRRRWDEAEGTSEGDALSVSSAASSCAPHHLAHHHDYSKVSPTPPKKPPRRNLSVSPTHANSPSSGYSYELRTHARSQDDLDEIQGAKNYLKHGRSVDQYVDGKLSYSEFEENHNSPRVAPVPNPRPSLKHRPQPVAITAMYENIVIKEQNPRRKLRRNNFGPQYENHEPRMDDRVRKYSNQDRSSLESLLDDQSMNSPSDCERYYDGQRVDIPLSPTHYEQPPTPDHPPPSARQAENSIHERIRPLSQLIMEVVEEIRIRKKSQADCTGDS